MGSAQYSIYLFGKPRITSGEKEIHISRKKSLGLLAFIAVSENRISRSRLCGILWPDKDESHARSALRTALFSLNSEFEESIIQSDEDYFFINESIWVDVIFFRNKIKCLNKNILYDSGILKELKEAASVYSGDFLSGFTIGRDCIDFEDWQFMQLENLRKSYSRTLERLIQAYTLNSMFAEAADFAEKWSICEPENEHIHRRLMELYAWQGRKRDALHQFDKCTSILKRVFDLEPEESTVRLYDSIKSNRLKKADLTAEKSPAMPLEPVLDCSVFYSTILSVGLTNSAEKILVQRPYDTASMVDILFHKSIEDILKKHSACTSFSISDSFTSLFGIPNSNEEDAYRALIAAIEILQTASNYGFIMTAGISTGLVYYRTDEAENRSASLIGPAVTEANLLRFYGDPGMIFVENSTWTNTKNAAVFEKQQRSIPGISRSKDIYRLKMGDGFASR